jgi:hypothetical protein
MSESNRRLVERYDMKVPARLYPPANGDDTHPRFVLTRDISSNGAYFHTKEPDSYAHRVQVELLLQVPSLDDGVKYMYMNTSGEVLRRDEAGIAVRFDDDHSFVPFL